MVDMFEGDVTGTAKDNCSRINSKAINTIRDISKSSEGCIDKYDISTRIYREKRKPEKATNGHVHLQTHVSGSEIPLRDLMVFS